VEVAMVVVMMVVVMVVVAVAAEMNHQVDAAVLMIQSQTLSQTQQQPVL